MTSYDEMVTIDTQAGVRIRFNPHDYGRWRIFEVESNKEIGSLEVDNEGMVIGADIQSKYQRKGIITAVVNCLVQRFGCEFYFWIPDGQTYDDGRHLSEEGAKLAKFLVNKRLASWINNETPLEEDF